MAEETAPSETKPRTPLPSGKTITKEVAQGAMQAQGTTPSESKPRTPLPSGRIDTKDVAEGTSGSKPRTPLPSGKTVAKDDSDGTMRAEDLAFLIDCLQNTTGGNVLIDCKEVAKKRNLINYRSVSNRVTTMRKRYGLPITSAKPSFIATNRGKKSKGYGKKPTKKDSKSSSSKDTDVDEDAAMDTDELERAVFGEPDDDEEDDDKPEYLFVVSNDENASV